MGRHPHAAAEPEYPAQATARAAASATSAASAQQAAIWEVLMSEPTNAELSQVLLNSVAPYLGIRGMAHFANAVVMAAERLSPGSPAVDHGAPAITINEHAHGDDHHD